MLDDRRADDDRTGDGAQPIMRLLNRPRQDLGGMLAIGSCGEPHVESDPDVGEPVAEIVANLVGASCDRERLGIGRLPVR